MIYYTEIQQCIVYIVQLYNSGGENHYLMFLAVTLST